MLKPLFDIDRLASAIDAGALILTPNLRLARKIREAWDQRCLTLGEQSWQPPTLWALDTWLDDCWMQLVDGAWPPALTGIPAQPCQEQWLWEVVLSGDEIAGANPSGFAELARRGWQLVREWRLPVADLAASHHQGARALARWGLIWEAKMTEHELLSAPRRADMVREAFVQGELLAPPHIYLVGFQSLSPLHQEVLDSTGHTPYPAPRPAAITTAKKISPDDPDREIACAARWAQQRAASDPQARIGVVVPDLASLRDKVERIFLHRFDPSACWPDQSYRPPPFNISAATPLTDTPLVAAALELLAINRQRLTIHDLTGVVNSPWWSTPSREGALRAAVLTALLDSGLAEMPSAQLKRTFADLESRTCPDRQDSPGYRLAAVANSHRRSPARQSFRGWRRLFESQLATLGWPGERPLNSIEYQALDHWRELLNELESLDKVASPVPLEEALKRLSQLAADTPFQGETPDAQVQILGTLEAAGLQFDHLWVMQLDDRHWPEATAPHPLLPVDLQRQHNMPRAVPARELSLARELFELFAASGEEVVFSHARQDGDIHLQPSALLTNLESTSLSVDDPCHPWSHAIADGANLEIVEDAWGPTLTVPESPLPGAGGLLAAQANCPFNAFARYRLGAEPLPRPVTGLSALARGNLAHFTLEAFWRGLSGQQALRDLAEEGRQQRLAEAIDAAFARFGRELAIPIAELGARHLALEKERIAALLQPWLAWELERLPFDIEGLELTGELDLDGLRIRMRIDRLDRQGGKGQVIIDYKTGSASLAGLTGERLLSPQLALYALSMPGPLAGLGYGLIHPRGVGFEGLATDDDTLPGARSLATRGLPETWQETLKIWHKQLKDIKDEIISGAAPVVFFSREAASYAADLEPLNRWPGRERLARFAELRGQARP